MEGPDWRKTLGFLVEGLVVLLAARATQPLAQSSPGPGRMGRTIVGKKVKLMGWDINSLTGQ